MSDSDEDQGQQQEYAIKPEKGVASMDTSDWPLLLKVSSNFQRGRPLVKNNGEKWAMQGFGVLADATILIYKKLTKEIKFWHSNVNQRHYHEVCSKLSLAQPARSNCRHILFQA